jgi:diguanylate cyclase (GGDEF)-like protein/PAS domain S-box-containing protein
MPFPFSFASRIPLAIGYFVTAAAAAALTRFDGGVACMWFATGLLIADLLCRPRNQWLRSIIACSIASFFATGMFGLGWNQALQFVAINMVEAVAAAWLFRRLGFSRQPLGSLEWLMYFILCAAVIAPLISAALAAASLTSMGRPPLQTFVQLYSGHALGTLMVTPLALLVSRERFRGSPMVAIRRHAAEGSVLFFAVAATALTVFSSDRLPLLFLPVLPVILITFRLGRATAAISVALVAAIGLFMTLAGQGPLHIVAGPMDTQIQFFQFYLAATVLTILPVAADLENRRRLHRSLRLSEMRYRLLAEHSTDILIHFNRDGIIRYISPSIRLFGGHDPAGLIGQDSHVLVAPEDLEDVRANYAATLAAGGETRTFEFKAATVDGSSRWYETHSRAIVDDGGEVDGVLSVVRDVTARKDSERQMAADALTDPLTGLFNRRAFRSALEGRSLDRGAASTDCVAVLDIDHFKSVNDSHGHAAGDEVLRGFARVARRMVREHDFIARIGGEEFAILFPDTSVEQAMLICERLRAEIARSSLPAGTEVVKITVSGGVAMLEHKGFEHALENADLALYSAKRNGRDQLAKAA